MRAVDIGIRHYDDFAVAELCHIKFIAYTAAQRLNNRYERLIGINLVKSALFHIEHLAAQRQYRLIAAVAPVLGTAACGVSLYKEKLCQLRALFMAVGELAREREALECAFSARCLSCLSCRFSRIGGGYCFFYYRLADGGIFL